MAVIGSGASGIQLVPSLQNVVNRLDHYARNKTWIAGTHGGGERILEPRYFFLASSSSLSPILTNISNSDSSWK